LALARAIEAVARDLIRSAVGSVFTGADRVDGERITPPLSGQAYLTAEATLLIDDADPFPWGIQ